MVQMMSKMENSRWWWFDSHHDGSKRSQWLQSTLSGLDNKTKAMLKLIEEDADSFAKRAEMYYKKRPELISMVEDFYRSHRLLAERYDQIKLDPGTRLVTTLGSPFASMKYHPDKAKNFMDKTYDSNSESFYSDDYAESEVDDPEHYEVVDQVEDSGQEDKYETSIVTKGGHIDNEDGNLLAPQVRQEVPTKVFDDGVMKLREEIAKLKEENKAQKAQLIEKDEAKKEVIRQLSLAVQVLKDENMELKKSIAKAPPLRKWSPLDFNKVKGGLFGMLFNGSPKSGPSVVAL
ncbi:classical arabinogalactan protein 26-like [Hibiscus syriacus]|uniref:Classical arabinogalactan protein 26-like n=1 Tax=Hibiscus syriacus TaxID=106335 RepID=A0A6A2Y655_HIBSY|nr:protein NETWORKED 3C-like [Hibiscus syriacus]KAE8676745.1 classical arabinogalactan protein 26-like [Hibiscus syriacus]